MQQPERGQIRAWASLVRPHSAALTAPVAVIGYLLTHASLGSWDWAFWCLYSVLWGLAGNLHNAVADYVIDRNDPHKSHFALVSGTVSKKTASVVSSAALLSLWILGVAGSGFDFTWSLLVTLGIASGMSYNWSSKSHGASGLMAGLSFPVPFLLAAHALSPDVVLVYVFLAVQFMMQNGFSGGYKDLASDATNMARSLGVTIRDGIARPTRASAAFSAGTRMVMVSAALAVSQTLGAKMATLAVSAVLFFLVALQSRQGAYSKKRHMAYFVLIEMVSYYALLCAVSSRLGVSYLAVLAAVPPVAFVLLNRLSWGTRIIPRT